MAENKHQEGTESSKPMEMRDAFGHALVELGRMLPQMVVLDADLHTSSKALYFKKAFPDRFFQVGIAEQNLFGISAGLALTGFIPFPSTFAVFAARRALDQIAISICYPKLKRQNPRFICWPADQPRRQLAQLYRGYRGDESAAQHARGGPWR